MGVIFRMEKCLLNVWEAMKGDAYMPFAVIQLIPLFNKLVKQVICDRIPLLLPVGEGGTNLYPRNHVHVDSVLLGRKMEA